MIAFICHKLFGWEYWAFNFAWNTYVRRAHKYKDGTKYVVCGGNHLHISLDDPYHKFKQVY